MRHLVALVLLLQVTMMALTTPAQTDVTPSSPALVQAIRTGGLPAAAALVGHYVWIDDGDVGWSVDELSGLASTSAVVVRGLVAQKKPSQLTQDETRITTDYVMSVSEGFKGNLAVGSRITVRTVGGFVRLGGDKTAEVRSGRVPHMRVGEEYVLFLQRSEGEGTLWMSYGPQGAFIFDVNGRTQSRARPTDPVFEKYNGMPRADFLRAVRGSVS